MKQLQKNAWHKTQYKVFRTCLQVSTHLTNKDQTGEVKCPRSDGHLVLKLSLSNIYRLLYQLRMTYSSDELKICSKDEHWSMYLLADLT